MTAHGYLHQKAEAAKTRRNGSAFCANMLYLRRLPKGLTPIPDSVLTTTASLINPTFFKSSSFLLLDSCKHVIFLPNKRVLQISWQWPSTSPAKGYDLTARKIPNGLPCRMTGWFPVPSRQVLNAVGVDRFIRDAINDINFKRVRVIARCARRLIWCEPFFRCPELLLLYLSASD